MIVINEIWGLMGLGRSVRVGKRPRVAKAWRCARSPADRVDAKLHLAPMEGVRIHHESWINPAIQIVDRIADRADGHALTALGGQARNVRRQDHVVIGKERGGRCRGLLLEDIETRRADPA